MAAKLSILLLLLGAFGLWAAEDGTKDGRQMVPFVIYMNVTDPTTAAPPIVPTIPCWPGFNCPLPFPQMPFPQMPFPQMPFPMPNWPFGR